MASLDKFTYDQGNSIHPSAPPLPSAPPPSTSDQPYVPFQDQSYYAPQFPGYPQPPTVNEYPFTPTMYPPPPVYEDRSLSRDMLESVNEFINNYSPFNFWEKSLERSDYDPERALFTYDCSTGDKYLYRKSKELRVDHLKLFIFNFLPRIAKTITFIGIKAIKVATLFEIVFERKSHHIGFKDRLINYGKDVLSIPGSILHFVGMNLASLYGLIRANDGRKVYHKLSEALPKCGINLVDNLEYKLNHFVPLKY